MLNIRTLLIVVIACLSATHANAQRRGRGYTQMTKYLKQQHNAIDDSIVAVAQRYTQRLDSLAEDRRTVVNTPTQGTPHFDNPYFYPLFIGSTLMEAPIRNTIGSVPPPTIGTPTAKRVMPKALPYISWALIEAYATHPELVDMNLAVPENMDDLTAPGNGQGRHKTGERSNVETRQEAQNAATAPVSISKENTNEQDILDLSDFHIHIRRPNFWTLRGSFSSQFMQYYVSDNWYKGGDNHVSMLANFNFEANYDNKRKLTFTNKLETKLGFQTSPSDTYHKFKTNADLLRLTDKLGVKAWHHWDYTLMLQSWTQFYKAYQSNSANVTSDFMSPFEAVLSAGMDYKLQKKRVNFTATLSPVAVNFKYCDRSALIGKHGISEEKHSKTDLGSTVTVNMTLKLCEQVNWVTRLYTFYDYKEHLKVEWENTINLKINKYLSTKLFLYPRFDNSVQKKEGDTYLQFNEYLSVGLDLNF